MKSSNASAFLALILGFALARRIRCAKFAAVADVLSPALARQLLSWAV